MFGLDPDNLPTRWLLTGWDTAADVLEAESQWGSVHYCAYNVNTQLALLLFQDFYMTEKTKCAGGGGDRGREVISNCFMLSYHISSAVSLFSGIFTD